MPSRFIQMKVSIHLPSPRLVSQRPLVLYVLVLLSLLFCLTFSAGAAPSSAHRTTRIGDAVAEFHFLRSECSERSFRDHSNYDLLGGLILDPAHTACLRGNGVTSQPLSPWGGFPVRSANSIRDLIGSAQRSELSVEMWLRSNSTVSLETSILSFSHVSSVSNFALRVCAKYLLLSFMPLMIYSYATLRYVLHFSQIDQTGSSSSFPNGTF
jgi:hypothetical protein